MSKLTDNADALFTATVIKKKLHEQGLTAADLGRRLDLTRAGISRALSRPHGMQTHVERVAKVLGCDVNDLVPSKAAERTQMRTMFGAHVDEGSVRLNAGCLIKKLTDAQRQRMDGHGWVLLQATSARPLDGTLVLLTTKEGKEYLMDYYRDAKDRDIVVLMSYDKSERPLTIKEEDIEQVRMVIAPLAQLPR